MEIKSQEKKESNFINPELVKSKIEDKEQIFILDVREEWEYENWHIKESVNIPLMQLQQNINKIPKDKEIITVCAHGVRSEQARQFLISNGYKAKTMYSGMVNWNSVYDIAEIQLNNKNIKVLQFRRIGKGCLSYLVINKDKALLIDPTIDIEIFRKTGEENNANIIAILDTHTHADHVDGIIFFPYIKYISPDSELKIKHGLIKNNQKIIINDITIKTISTPGHTPESMIYLLEDLAFTGDTLFIESIGRPDLNQDSKENVSILFNTLHKKILTLPENTKILPAHYSEKIKLEKNTPITSTLKELKENLNILKLNKEEFIDFIIKNTNQKPENFEAIKKINLGLIEADIEEIRELEAGPNRCAVS